MPFIDNTGVRVENQRGAFLRAFAIVLDQIERMILLNIAWALHLLPALLAFIFPELPLWLRVVGWTYSGVMIFPATGVVFHLIERACQGELIRVETVRDTIRGLSWRSLQILLPLYGIFLVLALLAWGAAKYPTLIIINILAQLAILLLAVVSVYWGPIFGAEPSSSIQGILRGSVQLTWHYPSATLPMVSVILLVWILGAVTVVGWFLIVPILVASLQTQLYRDCTEKRHP